MNVIVIVHMYASSFVMVTITTVKNIIHIQIYIYVIILHYKQPKKSVQSVIIRVTKGK